MHHPLDRALRKGFGLSVTIAIVAYLFVACDSGQHKCDKISDCKAGEACQANAATKLRECVVDTAICTPACAADEECKAGKCEKKTATVCTPACAAGETCDKGTCKKKPGCTSNTDCPGAGRECKAGTCVFIADGCTSDTDCSGATPRCNVDTHACVACTTATDCTGTNETCETATGKCVPKATGCNPPCASDETCKDGKCEKNTTPGCKEDSVCSGATPRCNLDTGHCVECVATSDCTGGQTCSNNVCAGRSMCVSDAECNNGEICNAGKCQTHPIDHVGDNCATEGCITGLQCIGVSATDPNARFCFQLCTADADCTDAFRNKCLTAGTASDGTPIQLCLRASKKGEFCGFSSNKQALCALDNTPPLYCDSTKKTCEEVILQKAEGDPCNKTTDNTEPPKRCDPAAGIFCEEATGTCKKARIANEGEECDSDGRNNALEVILCATGMLCIGFDQDRTLQRCHVPCKSVSAGGDSSECKVAGTKCEDLLPGPNPGLCFDTQCTTDTECAYPENRCTDAQSGGKICLPKLPSGPVTFGGLCKTPAKTYGCDISTDADIFCLSASGAQGAQGFCSRNCSKDDMCPSWTDGTNTIAATCVTAGANGTKFCLFDCGQPGQICPTGLTCQSISGGMTCLAP